MLASTELLRNLSRALGALDVDASAVLQTAGLTWKELEEVDGEDRRLPAHTVPRFWKAATATARDESIGVRVGSLARLEFFGVLGSVARASATLGDALVKTARYVALLNESIQLSFLIDGDRGQIWYRSLEQHPHPAQGDAILSTLLVLSRELSGRHLVPDAVRLGHPPPPDDAPYREVFGIAPTFEQLEYALVFPPDILTLPIATHDRDLGEVLSKRARDLVDGLASASSFSRRVRDVLEAELRGGNPMIENVAVQLGMHPKTLTRRLKQEGTSHSELLDALRKDLAEQHLSNSALNVTEVAFLLGFSDASAFNKAFRRWFGIAPLAFRARG